MSKFTISAGFTDAERSEVARLYWQAFSAKLGKILGPDARTFALFTQIISPEFALIAHHPVGAAIGVKTALLHAIKDQAKVVGNEQHGSAVFFAQTPNQVHNACLDRHI